MSITLRSLGQIEIDFTGPRASIKLDGQEVPMVTRLTLDLAVDEMPHVVIEQHVSAGSVRVDDAQVTVERAEPDHDAKRGPLKRFSDWLTSLEDS